MAIMYPKLEEVDSLHEKVMPGERALLERLNSMLDDRYDVFFQPRVNGSHMDVVVLCRNHGAMVIEVKDWDLSAYKIDGEVWSVYDSAKGTYHVLKRSPIDQVTKYRQALYTYYMDGFAEKAAVNQKMYGMIHRCVFFYHASRATAENIFWQHYRDEKYRNLQLVGREFLTDNQYFGQVMHRAYLNADGWPSFFFKDKWYGELKRLLQPSMHTMDNLHAHKVRLDKKQEKLVKSRPKRKQKVCGPAGSGKTMALAYLAANAAHRLRAEGRPHSEILILTYNITLRHYIHDALQDVPIEFCDDDIIIMHYHLYISLHEMGQDDSMDPGEFVIREPSNTYPVILVDEVQDYKKRWIRNIWKLLEDGGELVFFGDSTQNIYQNALEKDTRNIPRPYTGIGGNWYTLTKTHRTSNFISEFANAYKRDFLAEYQSEDIKPVQQSLFDASKILFYPCSSTEFTPQSIYRTVHSFAVENGLNPNDVAYLCTQRDTVRELAAIYQEHGKEVTTVFESQDTYEAVRDTFIHQGYQGGLLKKKIDDRLYDTRRNKKFNFRMETGKVKLTTIHSFKGWELDTIALVIPSDTTDSDEEDNIDELIYTGITRARHNLLIFSCDDKFNGFMERYIQTDSCHIEKGNI